VLRGAVVGCYRHRMSTSTFRHLARTTGARRLVAKREPMIGSKPASDAATKATHAMALTVSLVALPNLVIACGAPPGPTDAGVKSTPTADASAARQPSAAGGVTSPPTALDKAPSDTGTSDAAEPKTEQLSAAPVDLTTTVPGNEARCAGLVGHQLDLLHKSGPEALRQRSAPFETLVEVCKGRSLIASQLECRMNATSWSGLEQCARDALALEVEATPGRTFTASTADGVTPPALSVDRDYVAHGDACGLYVRDIYPSGGLFVVCGGKIVAGPMVGQAEIEIAITVARGQPKDAAAAREAVETAWATLGGTPPLREI
jgi:hypothetical protein